MRGGHLQEVADYERLGLDCSCTFKKVNLCNRAIFLLFIHV